MKEKTRGRAEKKVPRRLAQDGGEEMRREDRKGEENISRIAQGRATDV